MSRSSACGSCCPERKPSKRKFMLAVGFAALLATFALGMLGFLADRQMGDYEFDSKGIPHKVQSK